MQRKSAERFIERALAHLREAEGADAPAAYLSLLESHFHDLDRERTDLPLWPCNVNLVPSASIRAAAGPPSYRHLIYGLAEHFWLLRHVAGYRGDQHLLDVGCGYGKTALSMIRTIRPPGSYTGFDIQPRLVDFMRRLFDQLGVSDLYRVDCFSIDNEFYRGQGRAVRAEEFTFPYPAGRFDCCFLSSVFTHMLSEAAANYVRNLARVTRTGGRILVSAFLLDNAPHEGTGGDPWSDSERRLMLQDPPSPVDRGRLKVLRPESPGYLVACRSEFLTTTFKDAGCRAVGEPLWGSWSGRSDFFCYQDFLLFEKAG